VDKASQLPAGQGSSLVVFSFCPARKFSILMKCVESDPRWIYAAHRGASRSISIVVSAHSFSILLISLQWSEEESSTLVHKLFLWLFIMSLIGNIIKGVLGIVGALTQQQTNG